MDLQRKAHKQLLTFSRYIVFYISKLYFYVFINVRAWKPAFLKSSHIWTPHTTIYINKLEAVQKCAAHFIMSDYRRGSSVTKMLNSLKWKPVAIQYKELYLLMFYKIINKIVELSLPDYIIPAPKLQEGIVLNFCNQ